MIDPASLAPRLLAGSPGARATELSPALRGHAPARSRPRLAVFGVPLAIDVTWVFGLGLAAWTFADVLALQTPGRASAAYLLAGGAAGALALGSLALHEGGHWIMACRAGLPVTRVSLSLVGGALELGAAPRAAATELRLALGGPAASLAAAAFFAGGHVALVEAEADPLAATAAALVAVANLAVALLNLLPGLPLDGGRILKAVVWGLTGDEACAIRVALGAGRVLAIAFVLLALVASASGDAAAAIWSAALGLTIYGRA